MRYRAQDLLLPPGLLSLARIPLAVCFPLLIDRPALAALILVAAAVTDVLDGWVARRYGLVTVTGTALDPITDKSFVLVVAITLVIKGYLSPGMVLLLSTREVGELPLVAWFVWSHRARAARVRQPSANAPGKLATCLQFVSVCWAVLSGPLLGWWIAVTALAGGLAALSYWRRSLRAAQIGSAKPA